MAAVEAAQPPADIRLTGFAHRTALADATGWIDARFHTLGPETVAIEHAAGRTAVDSLVSPMDWPGADAAGVDGYAIQAADSEGAGDYNPLQLALIEDRTETRLPAGAAMLTASGAPLALGADAVVSFDAAHPTSAGTLEILAPVAKGTGVDRRGCDVRAGATVFAGPRRLRPQDIALLAAMGIARVAVARRPVVGLVVAGPTAAGPDALTPMLRALLARDGALVAVSAPAGPGRAALAQAMAGAAANADLLLVAGRSGTGMDDEAPLAIADAGGALDLHGIAIRPGGSAGLGRVGCAPALLLPGAPLACLAAYDMLAARAIRQLAGFATVLPYPVVEAVLERKIASPIGFADIVRVRLAGGRALLLGTAESGGLASTVQADGFVIVPDGSEGYAPGSSVRVYLYDEQGGGAGK